MKVFLLVAFLFLFLMRTYCFGQFSSNQVTREEAQQRFKLASDFVNDVISFPKKSVYKQKKYKTLSIYREISAYDSIKAESYVFYPYNGQYRIGSGSFTQIYINKKLFFRAISFDMYILFEKEGHFDSTVYNFLLFDSSFLRLNLLRKKDKLMNVYLDSGEAKFLKQIPLSFDFEYLKELYGGCFFENKFLKINKKQNVSPFLDLTELIERKDFESLRKLYKTKSQLFNFLIAEQLWFYHNKNNFLPSNMLEEIKKLDGVNYNRRFAEMEVLKIKYSLPWRPYYAYP